MGLGKRLREYFKRPEKYTKKEVFPGALELPARWPRLLLVAVGTSLATAVFWHYVDLRQLRHLETLEYGPDFAPLTCRSVFEEQRDHAIAVVKSELVVRSFWAVARAASLLLYVWPVVFHGARLGARRWFRSKNELVVTAIYGSLLGVSAVAKKLLSMHFKRWWLGSSGKSPGIWRPAVRFVQEKASKVYQTPLLLLALVVLVQRGGTAGQVVVGLLFLLPFIWPKAAEEVARKALARAPGRRLEDTQLRRQIEALAAHLGFPTDRIVQIKAAEPNAHVALFGRLQRLALNTGLLQLAPRQVLAVVGHELGHWWFQDTVYGAALKTVTSAALSAPFALVFENDWFFESFGFFTGGWHPVAVAFQMYSVLIEPATAAVDALDNFLSHPRELRADAFAAALGLRVPMWMGLVQMHRSYQGPPSYDPLYGRLKYSHPAVVDRVRALRKEVVEAAPLTLPFSPPPLPPPVLRPRPSPKPLSGDLAAPKTAVAPETPGALKAPLAPLAPETPLAPKEAAALGTPASETAVSPFALASEAAPAHPAPTPSFDAVMSITPEASDFVTASPAAAPPAAREAAKSGFLAPIPPPALDIQH